MQRVYLDLGGDGSGSGFSIMIALNADGSVPFAGITSPELPGLIGKTVEITGTVVSAGGASYGIFLTDMSQLAVK